MVTLDRSPSSAADTPSSRPPRTWTPDRGAALLLATVALGAVVGWWVGGRAARGASGGIPGLRVVLGVVALLVLIGVVASAAVLVAPGLRRVGEGATLEDGVGVPLVAHLAAPVDLTVLPALDAGSVAAAAFDPLRSLVVSRIGLPRPLLVVVAGPAAARAREEGDELPVWVGANLAIALARAGRRVLLVDARLDACVGADADGTPSEVMPRGAGLAGVLGGVSLAETSVAGPVPGLTVLPPGRRSDLPGDLSLDDATDLLAPAAARRLVEVAVDVEVVVALGPSLRPSRCGDSAADRDEPVGAGVLLLAVPEQRVRMRALRDQIARVRDDGVRILGAALVAGGPGR